MMFINAHIMREITNCKIVSDTSLFSGSIILKVTYKKIKNTKVKIRIKPTDDQNSSAKIVLKKSIIFK